MPKQKRPKSPKEYREEVKQYRNLFFEANRHGMDAQKQVTELKGKVEQQARYLQFARGAVFNCLIPHELRVYPEKHADRWDYWRDLRQRAMDYAKDHLLPPPAAEDYRSRDQAEAKCPLCGDGSSDPRSRGGFTYPNGLERHLSDFTHRCVVMSVLEQWWEDVQK